MYTRMLMVPTYTPEAVYKLEHKIDALQDLKTKEIIDQKEYELALNEVFNLSNHVLILSIINSNFLSHIGISESSLKNNKNVFDDYYYILENSYTKLISEKEDNNEPTSNITENYQNTIKKMNEIRTALPTIHKLIESFEN